ncbi:hypothetical protein VP01_659g5 [Puccinia sorghi]|uniref:Uncharacterized protein n=1 Tax=Puccinia sorghi TaxID=27349 RepID=A0A0L6UF82_9BASI|nr:hypothetical protein VP01_659g5 [Puccinia sorghi]
MKKYSPTSVDLGLATNLPLMVLDGTPSLLVTHNAHPSLPNQNIQDILLAAVANGFNSPSLRRTPSPPPSLDWSRLSLDQSAILVASPCRPRPSRHASDSHALPQASPRLPGSKFLSTCTPMVSTINVPTAREKLESDLPTTIFQGSLLAEIMVPPTQLLPGQVSHHIVAEPHDSLLNLENEVTSRCHNRSTIPLRDPTPLAIHPLYHTEPLADNLSMDCSPYAKVDPFPTPTPGKRLSLGGCYVSPRKASLPDWVVHEYLSAGPKTEPLPPLNPSRHISPPQKPHPPPHQRDPSKASSRNKDSHQPSGLDLTSKKYWRKKSRVDRASEPCPSSARHHDHHHGHSLPTPGKVFYPLLDQSQS